MQSFLFSSVVYWQKKNDYAIFVSMLIKSKAPSQNAFQLCFSYKFRDGAEALESRGSILPRDLPTRTESGSTREAQKAKANYISARFTRSCL